MARRIQVAQADATSFSARDVFGLPAFDRVFFSYALSMIPGWTDALGLSADHVSPGGRLHIVDFGQCDRLPAAFKVALFKFLDHYTVTPRPDLEAECRRAGAALGLALSFQRLHRGYTDYAVLARPGNGS
jgi:S-adenosylmethionine-diacylgycerolhomoserine-N-methlytransferase